MPQRTPTLFRKSCLAAAIAALTVAPSACSTLSGNPGSAPDAASDNVSDEGLFEAGLGTRDIGERNWDRVMYLLGFSEEAKRASRESAAPERGGETPARDEPVLFDEVDWALMEEDAPMPGSALDGSDMPDSDTAVVGPAGAPDDGVGGQAIVVVAADDADALDAETIVDADALQVGSRALSHEVGESETLWDIAKATTGDATNWHVLADVNDLAPDAAVYPGQILTIPADLVRLEPGVDDPAPVVALPASPGTAAEPARVEANGTASAASNGVAPEGSPVTPDDALAETTDAVRIAAAMPGRDFDVDAGETLWDFARRTTGDATNWQAIADANGFTDAEASLVRPGQTITVPLELVDEPPAGSRPDAADEPLVAAENAGEEITDALDGANVEAVAPSAGGDAGARARAIGTGDEEMVIRLPDVDAAGPVEPIPNASEQDGRTNADALPAESPAAGTSRLSADAEADEGALRIVDAAYRGGAGGEAVERGGSRSAADLPSRIMVSGTYYPKAVYNDADFSSSLLMRVSPGTTLQVSRAVGPWYEVQTEQGPGYVHTRDIK